MARYVVLSFEDNDAAEQYCRDLMKDQEDEEIKVVGLYAQPTAFCPGNCTTGKRVRAWTRGKKYGWWVCVVCKKPTKANLKDETLARHVISNGVNFLHQRTISQAVNLLSPEDPPASIHDVGWGVYNRS